MKWVQVLGVAIIAFAASQGFAEQDRWVSVTGHGEVTTEPDIAKVGVAIFVFDKDLLAAKRQTDAKIGSMLAMLAKLQIKTEDITTTELNVNPKYKEAGQSYDFIGYEVTRSMTVTLPKISRLNELLEGSIHAGTNRIERIELATSKEGKLRDQALKLAIANSKELAGSIAAGFGVRLGKVVTVSVKSGGTDVRMCVMAAPKSPEATYQPGIIAVTADIDVVFALKE
jgi:uncharacterized protein YggE